MGELGETLERAAKYFFIAVFRNLSPRQESILLFSVICIISIAAIVELWKASRPWQIRLGNFRKNLFARARTSPILRPCLRKSIRVSLILPIIMLIFGATGGWSHNFYVLLRWVVCGILVLSSIELSQVSNKFWLIVIGATALLFNPLAPFRFDKDTWSTLNVIAALVIGILLFISRSTNSTVQTTAKYNSPTQ